MKTRHRRLRRARTAQTCVMLVALAPVVAGAQTAAPATSAPQATAPPTYAPQATAPASYATASPPETPQGAAPATYSPQGAAPATYSPQGSAPATYAPQSVPPQAGTPSAAPGTTLPGSSINAVLSSPDINTKSAKVGDGFTMVVVPPYPGGDPNYAQATIHGHVADVTSAGQGRKAQLKLVFDTIAFASGQSQAISGSIVRIETKSENTTARQAIGAGAGAAVGSQTIGRILGGAFGSLVGILGGAVGGFLYGANDKANLDVVTGAKATIQTTTPIEVPRRQAPAS
jgi:hypothetical protein